METAADLKPQKPPPTHTKKQANPDTLPSPTFNYELVNFLQEASDFVSTRYLSRFCFIVLKGAHAAHDKS